MENNEDKRQMTVIAAEIEKQLEKMEAIRNHHHPSEEGRTTLRMIKYSIYVLESLLPKEEKYIREIIDTTWQEAYDDKQVPSTVTQDKIIRSVNETFKPYNK